MQNNLILGFKMYNVSKSDKEAMEQIAQQICEEEKRNPSPEKLLKNEDLSLAILEELSHNLNFEVRVRVALHKNTSSKILDNLVDDDIDFIHLAIAAHKNTMTSTLKKIHIYSSHNILLEMIHNPNFTDELFQDMFNYDSLHVQEVLAQTERTPNQLLETYAMNPELLPALVKNKKFASLDIDFTNCIIEREYYAGITSQDPLFSFIKKEDYHLFLANFKNHYKQIQDMSLSEQKRYHASLWIKKHKHFLTEEIVYLQKT